MTDYAQRVDEHQAAVEWTAANWREGALCAQTDPEAFFPERGGSTQDARGICAECDVTSFCLEYALTYDQRYGIWGGKSERERREIRRHRREIRRRLREIAADTAITTMTEQETL